MKTLQELHREVRLLEDDLRRLEARLGQVAVSLDELQHANDDPDGINFEAVRFCAEQLDFADHPLARLAPTTARLYLTVLLSLARFQEEIDVHLLIFAQWVLMQTSLEDSLSSLLLAGYDLGTKQLRDLFEWLGTGWAPMLMLDLIVGAGLSGPPSEKALEYIGELALLFQVDEETLERVAAAARCSLQQSADNVNQQLLSSTLDHYRIYWPKDLCGQADMSHITQLRKQLITILKVIESDKHSIGERYIEIKEEETYFQRVFWKVQNESMVNVGNPIAALVRRNSIGNGWALHMDYCAHHSGKLFQAKVRNMVYGIVASPYDTLGNIMIWLIQQKGGAE